ncbi:hypothetical protein M0R45_029104 [Rubus argutus]|uniref:DUF4283 domain-containing protein n=1 Tax=Rubus argutus TaxID=59490 RepID=A0AAW1WB71_RUBAR
MVVLAEYDGFGAIDVVPLHLLEVWVAVKGLSVALRNESALRLIGGTLGRIIRLDQGALRRREAIQRIRVSIDTQGCDQTLLVSAAPSPTDEVASAGISGGAKSGEVVLRMAGWKEATGEKASLLPLTSSVAKARREAPVKSTSVSPLFKTGTSLEKGPSSLFSVKGFTVEGLAAIPKAGAGD